MKVSLVVPVYNEKETIEELLRRLEALPIEKEIVVVDDCSSDGTAEILRSLPAEEVKAIFHETNRGKGAAIRTALEHVSGEIVAIQDADLEYFPEEIPALTEPIKRGEAEAVYGSRFKGTILGMSRLNRLANKMLTLTANLLFGVDISDEATCYKVFRTDVLKSLNLKCERFEFCPEVTAKLAKRGIKIKELPITYRARTVEEGKKIRWRDAFEAFFTLLKYRFKD